MAAAPFLILAFAVGLAASAARAETTLPTALETAISQTALADPAADAKSLRDFYKARGGKPVWDQARQAALASQIQSLALAEGLDPLAYAIPTPEGDAQRDVALTAALIRFGRDLAIGSAAPERSYGGFGHDSRGHFDPQKYLRELAEGRALDEAAAHVAPRFLGYARLKQGLDSARALANAGGWPQVPDGPKLVPGESDDRIIALRKRLIITGELPANLAEGREFDAPLTEAVKRFQLRHGLDADGTVGVRTLANLNVTAEARARQIAVNLERWRWMPRALGSHHIAVNIPAAALDVVEDGAVVLSMRVVVGDVKHPTPSMNASMSTMVLNPPWSVPPSIANKEILPKLRRDPNYLATSNLKILEYPEGSPEAAGDGIDWNAIGKKFPYRLRQPPGPDNALGQLKFNLIDSDDIYLHDTPNRKVFSRPYRALSHGCVRLERPVELGELLMGARWRGKLGEDIAANRATRTYRMERTIPVYMTYFTAWADEDGVVHFRDDIYGHDRRLAPVLDRARQPLGRAVARGDSKL